MKKILILSLLFAVSAPALTGHAGPAPENRDAVVVQTSLDTIR